MRTNKIAWIAIAMWGLSAAVFVWFFVHGNTVPGTDQRTAVVLKAEERQLILQEMRGLAWLWFVRLALRGKDVAEFVTTFNTFLARAVADGRRLTGHELLKSALPFVPQPGDRILLSGSIADHGIAIMSVWLSYAHTSCGMPKPRSAPAAA